MKSISKLFILAFLIIGMSAKAQVANDTSTQNAIIEALPKGLTPENADDDEIAQAARTVAFNMEGDLLINVTQVMVSLGELNQAKVFTQAVADKTNPPARFYNSMLNMASLGYEELTTLDITPLSKAMIEGMNYLNDAGSLRTVPAEAEN